MVGTVGSEAKAAVASEVLGVQRVVRYKEESLEDVLEAEFSGKVNVAYEGVGGPLLGAVCKQLAPGGQVWIYELPEQLDDRATPNPQAAIQAQLIRSLRASPYLASEPAAASFYLVPLPNPNP